MATISLDEKFEDDYALKVRSNLRSFHQNLDTANFSTIESRLAEDYFWNYDGNIILGRRTGRMVLEFFVTTALQGLHAQDIYNIVDGNKGAVLFRISGQQSGDFVGLAQQKSGYYNVMSAEIFNFNSDAEARQVVTVTPIGIMKNQMCGSIQVPNPPEETLEIASEKDSAFKTLIKQRMASIHVNTNRSDFESIAKLSAENVEVNENGLIAHGKDAFVELVTAQNAGQGAFPQKFFHDFDILADGTFGAINFIWQAQQTKKYLNIEVAEGAHVRLRSTLFFEFTDDGLIAKATGVYDEGVVSATLTGTGGYLYP